MLSLYFPAFEKDYVTFLIINQNKTITALHILHFDLKNKQKKFDYWVKDRPHGIRLRQKLNLQPLEKIPET